MSRARVEELVAGLHGRERDSCACALEARGPGVVPMLRNEFARRASSEVRQAIVEIIGGFRRPEDLPFLAQALMDPCDEVWQEAIDAFARQPGVASLDLLRLTLERVAAMPGSSVKKISCLREAVLEFEKPSPFGVGDPDGGHG